MNFLAYNEKNIWSAKQNHPELVVKDLTEFYPNVDADVVRASLMTRGVNKWLKVRRDLIAHKKKIKHQIKALQEEIPVLKTECQSKFCDTGMVDRGEKAPIDLSMYYQAQITYLKAKERLKVLENERGILKGLCMTERWQVWEGKSLEDMNTIKCSD